MWITAEVELPTELIEAHQSGQLVLFVGAGASVDAPSNLPLFKELAEEIGEVALTHFDGGPIDTFLGELDSDFDVHQEVLRRIDREDSLPNHVHEALVRLALSGAGPGRLITTNFDDHLRRAAHELGRDIDDIYIGPAVPIGRSFHGLVHLHGSVTRSAPELILTDRDFGRAYLTDAWATRFLREAFQEFVVLFVGFSHDDPIATYLGMGLPSNTRRFILTSDPESKRWSRLGITPVAYPAPNDNHSAMGHALSEWARLSEMNQLAHRARIQEIVRGGPPRDSVDADYLRSRLETAVGAKAFCDEASDPAWLAWLEDHDVFLALFDPKVQQASELQKASRLLADWFCDRFVSDSAVQIHALSTSCKLGLRFSSDLLSYLPWAIAKLSRDDPAAARRWSVVMATSVPGHSAIANFDNVEDTADAQTREVILRAVLRPRLSFGRSSWTRRAQPDLPAAEVTWPIRHYDLAALHAAIASEPGTLVNLLSVYENALASMYELLAAWGETTFDSTSYRRSAIEPHPQDRHPDVIDVVIDGLRDAGEVVISEDIGLLARWWSRPQALFRRLAVHLVGRAPHLSASERVAWLLERELLFDPATRHETYGVLRDSIGDANAVVKAQVLEQVDRGPSLPEGLPDADARIEYGKFNLLGWLVDADPSWREAADSLETISDHREFERREHPDLGHWSSTGSWSPDPPITIETIVDRIASGDAEGAAAAILDYRYSDRPLDGFSWEDQRGFLQSLAERNPDTALQLWSTERLARDERAGGVQQALIWGWGSASLGRTAAPIADAIEQVATASDLADAICHFLNRQLRSNADEFTDEVAVRFRSIAKAVWAQRRSYRDPQSEDPMSLALNAWPGVLAGFWISEIARRWRASPDDWSGLSSEERSALIALLRGTHATRAATVPAIASDVYFLFGADRAFTIERVFPLFEATGLERQSWEPYLYHPRWNNRFLADGFLRMTISMIARLDRLDNQRIGGQFWDLLIGVLTYSDIEESDRDSILHGLVIEGNGAHMPSFLDHLRYSLDPDEAEGMESAWTRWLSHFMTERLGGRPRRPHPAELAMWSDLVPYLGDHITEGVSLTEAVTSPFQQGFTVPSSDSEHLAMHAEALYEFVLRHIEGSSPFAAYSIQELCSAILPRLGTAKASALRAELESRGFRMR
jgi:hypothetical protein